MSEKPTPEIQRMLDEAAAIAADLAPKPPKMRNASMRSVRALKAFVKGVEGCEPHEIRAAVGWLVARYIDAPDAR